MSPDLQGSSCRRTQIGSLHSDTLEVTEDQLRKREIWGYETDRFFTIDDCKKNKDGIYVIDTDKVPTQKQFETRG